MLYIPTNAHKHLRLFVGSPDSANGTHLLGVLHMLIVQVVDSRAERRVILYLYKLSKLVECVVEKMSPCVICGEGRKKLVMK